MCISVLELGLWIDETFTGLRVFKVVPKLLGSLRPPGFILGNCFGKCELVPSIVDPHVIKTPKTVEQVGWAVHRRWIKTGTEEM